MLPNPLRSNMEGLFADDFSDVLIHHDHSATMLNAKAYTIGSDIFFAPGQYNPYTAVGRKLLVHELTHVIQQREEAALASVDSPEDGSLTCYSSDSSY